MEPFRTNTPDEIIEIVQAFKEGKPIQCRDYGSWQDVNIPCWDFANLQYRIKGRPRAGYGEKYFYVSDDLRVVWTVDGDSTNHIRYSEDTLRYESGNYFLDHEDVLAFLTKIKALLEND